MAPVRTIRVICVATVGEAEIMANAGITGLLLTSPLADPYKMTRIVRTGAMVVVDHADQVQWYEEAARKADREIDVLVDLDVGDHRTGARSTEQAVILARAVDAASGLRLRGIQAYSVQGSHAGDVPTRKNLSEQVFQQAVETR